MKILLCFLMIVLLNSCCYVSSAISIQTNTYEANININHAKKLDSMGMPPYNISNYYFIIYFNKGY